MDISRSINSIKNQPNTGEGSTSRSTSSPGLKEDVIFVALGKDKKESITLLAWALHTSAGKKICILHIHQPAQRIPIGITIASINMVNERDVKAYHDKERLDMHKVLDSYVHTCESAGVEADKLCKESSKIEKSIVELIEENGIKWLVMGAAANKCFSKKMKEIRSDKAKFVRENAPGFCHIWFVCKGNLIHTRASKSNTIIDKFQGSPYSSYASTSPSTTTWRSSSYSEDSHNSVHNYHKVNSVNFPLLSPYGSKSAYHQNPSNQELILELEEPKSDDINDKLHKIMNDAKTYKKEAYEESIKRSKAERDVIEALIRLKAAENLHSEKIRSLEETLTKRTEEVQLTRLELEGVMNELRLAQDFKLSMESKAAMSEKMVDDLEKNMNSAVELLQKYKQERDELQVKRDDALKEAEEFRKQHCDASSSSPCHLLPEFSFPEIKEATNNFSSSLKIGEGGYGVVYLGSLKQNKVAIKTLNPRSEDPEQGPLQLQNEVDILSKLRHPNIVTLIGACREPWALVFKYVPCGNLEDRLNCKDNTPPLTWKTRIRIASDLCSALIYMHSFPPRGVVHADVKPANVLLDANYASKLCDFGISRELSLDEFSANNTTRCFWMTRPMGTRAYVAPEVIEDGELTTRSDVYSFGVILLRLLTGKPAKQKTNEIQTALRNGKLKDLMDPTAGDWPFVQAEQLAHLAIRCTDIEKKNRPNLATDVWQVLEPMKVSSGVSLRQIPSYFVCPISQVCTKPFSRKSCKIQW